MKNIKYFRKDKRSLERSVLLYFPKEKVKSDLELKFLRNSIEPKFQSINDDIEEVLKRLNVNIKVVLPKIKVKKIKNINSKSLEVALNIGIQNKEEIRIIIGDKERQDMVSLSLNILYSHVIEIFHSNIENGWSKNSMHFTSTLKTEIDKIYSAIIDIMLDISIFNSLKDFSKSLDLELKRTISIEKAKFALKKEYTSYYGEIINNTEYISIASLCRFGTKIYDIEFQDYIDKWSEFLEFLCSENKNPPIELCSFKAEMLNNSTTSSSIDLKLSDVENIYDEQFKYFRDIYQISKNKLQKKLSNINKTGIYLYLRVYRKPHLKKHRRRIIAFFGGKYFKIGKDKIISFEEYKHNCNLRKKIDSCADYIDIFRFEVK